MIVARISDKQSDAEHLLVRRGRWLEPRAHLVTNKARLDRLLMLMRLQLDGRASETAYARTVRDWLARHGLGGASPAHRGPPTR